MAQQVSKWVVRLPAEQRQELEKITRSQKATTVVAKRARILPNVLDERAKLNWSPYAAAIPPKVRRWRRVSSRRTRRRVDRAEEMWKLIEIDYPRAEQITLVCDNLNTHDIASFYARYDAATAHSLSQKLRIVHTPRNGNWLNMAEMELSILARQCLNRRFDSADQMQRHIDAGQNGCNQKQLGTCWRFNNQEARVKLKSLYPQLDI